jgi:hypothetical protein
MAKYRIRVVPMAVTMFTKGRMLAGSTISKYIPVRSITDLVVSRCRGLPSRMVPGLTS